MPELPEEPKAGEPLRATWARRLLTLLRSMRLRAGPGIVLSADAEGTSVALAPELRVRAKPRPFAVRLALDNDSNAAAGAIAVYCCLPPETAEAVRYGAQALAPGASVQLGTGANPWVRLEAASDQTPPLWLCVIAPDEQSGSGSGSGSSGSGSSGSSGSGSSGSGSQGEAGTWELQFAATAPTQSKSGDYPCKAHLVAECSLSGGVIQYHLGSLLLDGTGTVLPDTEATPTSGKPGMSIERYQHTGTGTDNADGALQLYKFPDDDTMTISASATTVDDLLHIVVRDRTATRRKVNYVKLSDLVAGKFTAVTDVGISSAGYFYVDKTEFTFDGRQFTAAAPVRTNLFEVKPCAS